MDRDFKTQFKAKIVAEKKRRTRKLNQHRKSGSSDSFPYLQKEDANRRKANRNRICVSEGLTKCRKMRKQSQTEFAEFLGISRRALVNYENGTRPVGSDILEKLLSDERIDLHSVFDLAPEPVPIRDRLQIAELTVNLLAACLRQHPNADLNDLFSAVKHPVGWWPKSTRTSSQNIEKAATKILDLLDQEYLELHSDDNHTVQNSEANI
ncbi:helix-turn-helix transcriptional regulator [Ruegeria sp. HKCCA4812]|uniref:helix-turn-helix domain-containing protein n=1 Tax=Ruegeria sp. HKCCA4812 TaxID=2682993 RepID=UPI001487F10B|nr:helix-turn-helix transcriptional regulator [Ruegeria sp. HKCCA4812]